MKKTPVKTDTCMLFLGGICEAIADTVPIRINPMRVQSLVFWPLGAAFMNKKRVVSDAYGRGYPRADVKGSVAV